jgi:hypothetical protein
LAASSERQWKAIVLTYPFVPVLCVVCSTEQRFPLSPTDNGSSPTLRHRHHLDWERSALAMPGSGFHHRFACSQFCAQWFVWENSTRREFQILCAREERKTEQKISAPKNGAYPHHHHPRPHPTPWALSCSPQSPRDIFSSTTATLPHEKSHCCSFKVACPPLPPTNKSSIPHFNDSVTLCTQNFFLYLLHFL